MHNISPHQNALELVGDTNFQHCDNVVYHSYFILIANDSMKFNNLPLYYLIDVENEIP